MARNAALPSGNIAALPSARKAVLLFGWTDALLNRRTSAFPLARNAALPSGNIAALPSVRIAVLLFDWTDAVLTQMTAALGR